MTRSKSSLDRYRFDWEGCFKHHQLEEYGHVERGTKILMSRGCLCFLFSTAILLSVIGSRIAHKMLNKAMSRLPLAA